MFLSNLNKDHACIIALISVSRVVKFHNCITGLLHDTTVLEIEYIAEQACLFQVMSNMITKFYDIFFRKFAALIVFV